MILQVRVQPAIITSVKKEKKNFKNSNWPICDPQWSTRKNWESRWRPFKGRSTHWNSSALKPRWHNKCHPLSFWSAVDKNRCWILGPRKERSTSLCQRNWKTTSQMTRRRTPKSSDWLHKKSFLKLQVIALLLFF